MKKLIAVIVTIVALGNVATAEPVGLKAPCKRLLQLSKLNLQTSKMGYDSPEYRQAQTQLKDFIVDADDSKEPGLWIYNGIDLDKDGKIDDVKRGCGSGLGRLCTLFVGLSSNNTYDTSKVSDISFFYLLKLNKKIYLIAETDGSTSPYTKQDNINIFYLTKTGASEVCDGKN